MQAGLRIIGSDADEALWGDDHIGCIDHIAAGAPKEVLPGS